MQKINIKKYFSFFIAFTVFYAIFYLYFKREVGNDSSISEWLINYQGGFTRRGLIGEILYHIHTVSGIGLNYILFVFVVVAYGVFFFILYKMVTSIKLNFINTLCASSKCFE